ncbi:uncharacterized protein LOC110746776 [Prunus avium]|uniref:Uncharacterized protein LOC110746776 n=1 Tax=Prunus avium TaxID=42229 RepID=A0A6P5RIA1_PRUAV|nr:uncharacterized protein LOC110746776 [Prunus avium]
MPGISLDLISHKLNISPTFKLVHQKQGAYNTERYEAIKVEVDKLETIDFIQEVTYPIWLANSIFVKKTNELWCMCQDYTDLNKACPKDSFPVLRINQLVNKIFAELIGTSMKVYMDDMLVKSKTADQHLHNLSLMFGVLKKYNMRLNPNKCAFDVSSGKFEGEKIKALLNMQVPKT